MVLFVAAVPLPTVIDVQFNVPAPVITAVTFAAAALFNVTAPDIVKEELIDNVAPEAEKTSAAPLVAPYKTPSALVSAPPSLCPSPRHSLPS